MRIEAEQQVAATAEQVYARIADIGGRPRWLIELRRVDSNQIAAPGVRFTGASRFAFHELHGASEVKVADAVAEIVEEVHIGARFVSTWTVTPNADGATVSHRLDLDLPRGPLAFVGRLLFGRSLRRMSKRGLEKLAELLSQAS